MPNFSIEPLVSTDRSQVEQICRTYWGDAMVVAHGVIFHPAELPGFKAVQADRIVGLLTYNLVGENCEIIALASLQESMGIGTALIDTVRDTARRAHARRLWLITTNDNLHALRFYQKRGFELVAIHRHAMDESRKIKPQIPLVGADGIPLRDEIELELLLAV